MTQPTPEITVTIKHSEPLVDEDGVYYCDSFSEWHWEHDGKRYVQPFVWGDDEDEQAALKRGAVFIADFHRKEADR